MSLSGDNKIKIKIDDSETIIETTIKTLEFIINKGHQKVKIQTYNIEKDKIEYVDVVSCDLDSYLENVIEIIDEETNSEIILTNDQKIYSNQNKWIETNNLIEEDKVLIVQPINKSIDYIEDDE